MEYLPLTVFQQSIYDIPTFREKSSLYISFMLYFHGAVDTAVLKEAVARLFMTNETLRLRFKEVDGELRQYVAEYTKPDVAVLDFSSADDARVNDWTRRQQGTIENMFDHPLFYFTILVLRDATACFIKANHVVCDGWSSKVIRKQMEEEYTALMEQRDTGVVNRPSFVPIIKKHVAFIASEGYRKSIEYWMFKLRPPIDATSFKPDHPNQDDKRINIIEFPMPEEITQRINAFCAGHFTSPLMFFMAVTGTCLFKVNGAGNVVLGTFYHNRITAEEQNTIGQFATSLALRLELNGEINFLQVVKMVMNEMKSGIKHNYLTRHTHTILKEEAVRHGFIPPPTGGQDAGDTHGPTGPIGGGMAGGNGAPREFHGMDTAVSFEKYEPNEKITMVMPADEFCQLMLLVKQIGERLSIILQYWVAVFSKGEMERFYKSILTLTRDILDDPGKKISELPFSFHVE